MSFLTVLLAFAVAISAVRGQDNACSEVTSGQTTDVKMPTPQLVIDPPGGEYKYPDRCPGMQVGVYVRACARPGDSGSVSMNSNDLQVSIQNDVPVEVTGFEYCG